MTSLNLPNVLICNLYKDLFQKNARTKCIIFIVFYTIIVNEEWILIEIKNGSIFDIYYIIQS